MTDITDADREAALGVITDAAGWSTQGHVDLPSADILDALIALGWGPTPKPAVSRESLDALVEKHFPPLEPRVQRSPNMRGDDSSVDARDDERSAIDTYLDYVFDSGIFDQSVDEQVQAARREVIDWIESYDDSDVTMFLKVREHFGLEADRG